MSCQGNYLSNVACAAKSGISKMASKSASVAGGAGKAYAGRVGKNIETMKGAGGKVADVAGKVGKAYVDQGKKNASAIAGAARGVSGFYVGQNRKTIKAATAMTSGLTSFAGDVRSAKQAHDAATNGPKKKARQAVEAYKRGVMNTKLGAGGKVATAAAGAVGYTFFGGGEGDKLAGAINAAGFAATATVVARERAYLKAPKGQAARDSLKDATKEYDAAQKSANAVYKNAVLSSARQLAGRVKAARLG